MMLSYRTRSRLKRAGTVLLTVLVAALVVWVIWFFWLSRFVVYTRDQGAVIDMDSPSTQLFGEVAVKPEIKNPISIYYNEGENAINTSKELEQIYGYYITGAMLEKDISAIRPQIQALEKGTPVMIDVKSIYGNFFYSSSVSSYRNGDLDTAAMDDLIEYLDLSGMYTIARVPALRDRNFGLDNVSSGLPVAAGYLWMDERGCYWLNPANEATIAYLVQIATELRNLGFDEVVFTDYYFPKTDKIVYKKDKTEALTNTARMLVNTCSTDAFAVSFAYGGTTFTLPEGRSRMYMENVAAADVVTAAENSGVEDKQVKVVFMATVHDTRYDQYGVLRPIDEAH